jgi:hypothetical protein
MQIPRLMGHAFGSTEVVKGQIVEGDGIVVLPLEQVYKMIQEPSNPNRGHKGLCSMESRAECIRRRIQIHSAPHLFNPPATIRDGLMRIEGTKVLRFLEHRAECIRRRVRTCSVPHRYKRPQRFLGLESDPISIVVSDTMDRVLARVSRGVAARSIMILWKGPCHTIDRPNPPSLKRFNTPLRNA